MLNTLSTATSNAVTDRMVQAQLEANADGLLMVEPSGKIVFFNQRFAEIWRLPAGILESRSDEAALGCVERLLVNPSEFYERVRYLYEHPRETSTDLIYLTDQRIVERYSAPVLDPSTGTLFGRIWQFRDVTSRVKAEEGLRQSEIRYRTLVEHSPVGIWQTTPSGETLYMNRAMCELFEIEDPREMADRTYRDFYTPHSIAVVQREHAKRRRGQASTYEVEIIGVRGGRRTAMIYGAPILDAEGEVSSFIASIVDVTQERLSRRLLEAAQDHVRRLNAELEARVVQRTRQLQEAHAQMEAFCYTVSHDLKAPLRAICSFADILLEEISPSISRECREALLTIERSALRMDQLIKDLLEFSRVARCELHLQPLSTAAVLKQTIQQLAEHSQGGAPEVEIVGSLPLVMAHEVALEQVFMNLLNNARKFVRPGNTPKIRAYSENQADRARIVIEDNGIGIAPEHRERIFRVFERLHPCSEFSGTGVGLAIVKTYIEKMGGSVGVESVPEKGSRFWIELPLASDSAQSFKPPQSR